MTARFAKPLFAILLGVVCIAGCSMDGKQAEETTSLLSDTKPPASKVTMASFSDQEEAADDKKDQADEKDKTESKSKKRKITIKTNYGDIGIELLDKEAPLSSKNFLAYAKEGYYDGTIFHRVIDGFMIQGGGFTKDMKKKKTKDPIKNESNNGVKNSKYTLAMARTGDPHSATSQFYISVADNPSLDRENARDGWGYAVFGRVVSGQKVVDKIGKVRTKTYGRMGDVPAEQIVIEKVTIVE